MKRKLNGKESGNGKPVFAIPYARVSSAAQLRRGHGIDSQLSRCREFAAFKQYEIAATFRDEGVSGGLIDRPGMKEMLAYLKAHRREAKFVILVDDISRLARDIRAHLTLRDAIEAVGARLESPSIEFGDDPVGRFTENVQALTAQLDREKNAERVNARMRARVLAGYYIFAPVVGYRFEKVEGHGKMLVRDEPNAAIIAEGLESYAQGRFASPAEFRRWLQGFPSIPRNSRGEVRLQLAIDILKRPLYAGYFSVKSWGVPLQRGQHEALISFETWKKIQDRLAGKANAPFRKDLNADFPLRGSVACTAATS